jgi:hypothetical protein
MTWSPVKLTVMVLLVSPTPKLTVPLGRVPPKAAASRPLTAQSRAGVEADVAHHVEGEAAGVGRRLQRWTW